METRHEQPVVTPPPAPPAGGFFHDLFSRELLRYLGPGFIVTIGFIDPGNWATNIAGGSEFGYDLLWVVSLSTLMLIFLQHLSAKLGIVTGRSLAVNVRANLPRPVAWVAGVTIVLACIATDIAEYLGAALGFYLLFGIPLWLGRADHRGPRLHRHPRAGVPPTRAHDRRLSGDHRRLLHRRAVPRRSRLGGSDAPAGWSRP